MNKTEIETLPLSVWPGKLSCRRQGFFIGDKFRGRLVARAEVLTEDDAKLFASAPAMRAAIIRFMAAKVPAKSEDPETIAARNEAWCALLDGIADPHCAAPGIVFSQQT